jgi:ATP-dependent DNA helicase RecG
LKKDELLLLVEEGEGLTVEFKEKFTPKIAQDMVGFANSIGGKIILGVSDQGKIVGELLTGQLKAEIFSLGRNCDPEIKITVKQIEAVVVITIEEGVDKPYSCSGSYYKRFDAVTQKLTRNETKAIFDNYSLAQYDQKANLEIKISDISIKKVSDFYRAANIKYKVTRSTLSNILKSLNLMSGAHINNAGALFFAEKTDPFFLHSQVMLLAFKDFVGVQIFDRKEVRADLLTQFNEVEFFLKRHLSLQAIIKTSRRKNIFEIPQEAWREAIANAIVHRDYRIGGTSIQVRVFPDRIEIINPGKLAKGITIENIGEISSRRNEVIADMFARIDVVEKAGTGIVRIKEAMKNANLRPPLFEDYGDFFKTTLFKPGEVKGQKIIEFLEKVPRKGTQKKYPEKVPRKGTQKKYPEKVPNNFMSKIGVSAQKILEGIRKNPDITMAELAIEVGISYDAVKKHLAKLKLKKLIKRIGPDKGGKWVAQ